MGEKRRNWCDKKHVEKAKEGMYTLESKERKVGYCCLYMCFGLAFFIPAILHSVGSGRGTTMNELYGH